MATVIHPIPGKNCVGKIYVNGVMKTATFINGEFETVDEDLLEILVLPPLSCTIEE